MCIAIIFNYFVNITIHNAQIHWLNMIVTLSSLSECLVVQMSKTQRQVKKQTFWYTKVSINTILPGYWCIIVLRKRILAILYSFQYFPLNVNSIILHVKRQFVWIRVLGVHVCPCTTAVYKIYFRIILESFAWQETQWWLRSFFSFIN